jgi:hypothetical protein
MPANTTSETVAARIIERRLGVPASKEAYRCDAYFVWYPAPIDIFTRQIVYWYGLFSHRRLSFEWKGLLQIPLDRQHDAAAQSVLAERRLMFDGAQGS